MTEYTRREEKLEKKWSRPPRPSQRNGRAPQGTYTRREKIRVLKRQRFLTIPSRAAERLELEDVLHPQQTTYTPLQYKFLHRGDEEVYIGRLIRFSERYQHRLISWKNLYLIPRFPTIQ